MPLTERKKREIHAIAMACDEALRSLLEWKARNGLKRHQNRLSKSPAVSLRKRAG